MPIDRVTDCLRLAAALLLLASTSGAQPTATADPNASETLQAQLQASREAVAAAPDDAAAHVERARLLLGAGLGEASRAVARRAVELDPDSAAAHWTLGRTLAADKAGREFQGDFEYQAAETAFRRSLDLNPDDPAARFSLAVLLERDQTGWRYGPEARVGEAIQQYAILLKHNANPDAVRNLLAALLRDQRYEELKDLLAQIGPEKSPVMQLAALATADGHPTAVSWATRSLRYEDQRKALVQAASLLAQIRAYRPAAGLLAAASRGAVNAQELSTRAAMLERVSPHTDVPAVSGPAAPAFALLIDTYRAKPIEKLFEYRSRHAARLLANPDYVAEFRQGLERVYSRMRAGGSSADATLDLAMATRLSRVEGEPGMGYKVEASVIGRRSTFFVVEEEGVYKLLDIVSRPGENLTDLAREVLARVEAGRVDRARRLLVWAYELRMASAAETADPLSGPVFARFWEPDAAVGIDEVRWAAASLLAETPYDAEAAIEILLPARERAASPKERIRFDIALATAYTKLRRGKELLEVARPLYEAFPKSDIGHSLLAVALMQLERWDELDQHLQVRLRKNANDVSALRFQMQAAVQRADLRTARQAADSIEAVREMGAAELNNVAWAALVAERADDIAIHQIERAVELTAKSPNKDLLNTAAALVAEVGRPAKARDLLLQSMELGGLIEPDSNSWYVLGRIAEQYGEIAAARTMYERVERPEHENEVRSSPYWLAQRRLEAGADMGAAP